MYYPKISVAIVVFNAVSTLEASIQSVFSQSYENIELVVIDGGSTDGTIGILNKYNAELGYWHTKKDKGIFDAMNQAQDIANGDFIIFLGSDDIFYNKTVVKDFVNQIKDQDSVYYGDVYLSNEKRLYDGSFNTMRLALQCFSHQAIFYPKVVYKKFQYNIKYKYAADYDLNMQVWGKYKPFLRLDLITVLFNQNGQGSLNEDKVFLRDKVYITYRNLGVVPSLIVIVQKLKLLIFGKKIVFNFYR